MATIKKIVCICFLLFILFTSANAQKNVDSTADSSQHIAEKYLIQQQQQQKLDSIVAAQLHNELQLVTNDDQKKKELEGRLRGITVKDSIRKAEQLQKIAELKKKAKAYPVVLLTDTLFTIYTGIGSFRPVERATAISARIKKLYDDAFFKPDSLVAIQNETTYDIVYNNDVIIMSITDLDALWYAQSPDSLAVSYLAKIKTDIVRAREDNSLVNWLKRIGYISLIILGIGIIVFGINRLFRYSSKVISSKKEKYFSGIRLKKITLLSPGQHYTLVLRINNVLRIAIIILSIYLALPLLFSVFPQTKFFADVLLGWITTPAKAVLNGVLDFLPNLFTIVVVYIVTRYIVKLVKYFAYEIEGGAITINGFYKEWASPTFNIIRVIIYAFMLVIIWPYLPGSSSPAFQGVTVFAGLLISLGSSSAIANIVSGLVITYMRPFKKGDRVKVGEVVGDVVEKTMLVIRIRTIKNEDITIPNSTIMSSYTINYSANAENVGLIIHSTVTIGYDVPWKDVHQALIDAALRCEFILKEPIPFVLQTSLDDFYVSYQVNAYTKEANKQALIYSSLHQNIQDVCNERGIEIMSPHYNAMRDGSATTIPPGYMPQDYKAPGFNVHVREDK